MTARASDFDNGLPDFPEVTINLIDALRDYIVCNDEICADFLREGSVTPEQIRRWKAERGTLMNILTQLEAETFEGWGPDWDFWKTVTL